MPNAPRTVKDVPAQEFVIALAQYFRSTGKVRLASAITRLPVKISRGERRLGALDTTAATRRRKENMRERPRPFDSQCVYPRVALATMRFSSRRSRVWSRFRVSHRRVFFRVCGAGPCFPRALARMCAVHRSTGIALADGKRLHCRHERLPGVGCTISPFVALARAEHAPSPGRLDAA